MERHRPDEAAVRDALKKETAEVEEASAAEDGATDEGTGDGSAPPVEAEAEPDAQPEDELSVVQRERAEYLDLAKRTQADFENYRKRAARDIASAGERARVGLIRELLPTVDNLERALATAPEGDPLIEGVKLVLMDLQGLLSRAGVEPIEPQGETFDPNVHEALTTREQEGVEAGVVLDVVEKGYRTNGTVLRPARVVVSG